MRNKVVRFIFYGNYFLAFVIIALSLETAFQMHLPLCTPVYYALIATTVIIYYTYAYASSAAGGTSPNERTLWYIRHRKFIRISQRVLIVTACILAIWLAVKNINGILSLPLFYWCILALIFAASLLYYGLIPVKTSAFNLRSTGWLKAFVIGFLWACCVGFLPVTELKLERHTNIQVPDLIYWAFLKNWMFCAVNAIIFDIKDYAEDSIHNLRTIVVRMGLRKTIFYVLIPLLIAGITWLIILTSYYGFPKPAIILNLVPFIALLFIVYAMHKRRPILYYLVIVDGLLLLKACCGIASSFFTR
ncbi:hypothetical protein ACTHGU_00090 [Chitinophagaceae bacterium MMS25-I14]